MEKKIRNALVIINICLLGLAFFGVLRIIREIPDSMTEAVESRLQEEVELLGREGGVYSYRTKVSFPVEGEVEFQAKKEEGLETNYEEAMFHFLAEAYFQPGETDWEETQENGFTAWRLTIFYPAKEGQSLSEFCGYVEGFAKLWEDSGISARSSYAYTSFPELRFQKKGGNGSRAFQYCLSYGSENLTEDFYEKLYDFLRDWQADTESASGRAARLEEEQRQQAEEMKRNMEENLDFYLAREAAVVFRLEDGREYRLIGIDYAMGNAYYSLFGVEADGLSCFLVNPMPFDQAWGHAAFLTFFDEKLGFACLGDRTAEGGRLYRTEDGGVTFTEIEWPQVERKLEGEIPYYPYTMPEEIYESGEKLYLVVNQGSLGGYVNENGIHPRAVFVSEDQGQSWSYEREIE